MTQEYKAERTISAVIKEEQQVDNIVSPSGVRLID